jgi:hypothetical protein
MPFLWVHHAEMARKPSSARTRKKRPLPLRVTLPTAKSATLPQAMTPAPDAITSSDSSPKAWIWNRFPSGSRMSMLYSPTARNVWRGSMPVS